jgi:molybdopterin-guanine dinucleotide biosynthesis protein A
MGVDKSLVRLADRPLVQHAIEILRTAGLDPKIAGARAELSSFAQIISDEPKQLGLGPLAGICSALPTGTRRFAVFLPIDLPLIPPDLIKYLVHHATVSGSAITVVSVAAFIQTFPVVIDRAALPALQRSLASGDRNCLRAFQSSASAIGRPFTTLPVESIVQPGLVHHPWGLIVGQWFLNINSPQDLLVAEAVFARAHGKLVK